MKQYITNFTIGIVKNVCVCVCVSVCLCMTESLCYIAEIGTTFQINYALIKNKSFKAV